MSNRTPGPYQIQNAMSVLLAARARLLSEEPDIADDAKLYLDCLDATSGDAFEIIDLIIAAALHADDMAEQAAKRAADIAERRARFKRRNEQLRGVAFAMLEALDVMKFERPDYTATIANRPAKVIVIDDTALPPAMVRINREPDKTLIAAALKAGNTVPGAEWSNSAPGLTIRTR